MTVLLALLLLAQGATREVIGVWARWGAFRDTRPLRCFAIARPVTAAGESDPRGGYAGVSARAGPGGAPAIYLRLSLPRAARGVLTLAIGDRRFALVGTAQVARAPDGATDRAVIGAMRGARSMSLVATAPNGAPLVDTYALTGAATAIDAAQLACAGG